MARRCRDQNRDVLDRITTVLETLAQERDVEPAEYRGLMAFRKNHPPKFSGNYDPEGARLWLAETEKIFEAMGVTSRNFQPEFILKLCELCDICIKYVIMVLVVCCCGCLEVRLIN